MIELAIRDLLLADSTITQTVGTRVHAVILPKDGTYPAITFQLISDTESPTMTSTGQQQTRLQIDCWATSYVQAKQLQEAARTLLGGCTGTLTDGTFIQCCQLENRIDFYEDSANVYRAMSDYILTY